MRTAGEKLESQIQFNQHQPDAKSNVFIQAWAGKEGYVPMGICLLVALVPVVFAARLFEPYIAAKEILIQTGTASAALLWIFTARSNHGVMPLTPAWIPLLMLALLVPLSLLWTSSPSASFGEVQRFATYLLLFAITLSSMRRAEYRTALATALVLAGAIEAVYVLWQFAFGDPIFSAAELPGKWRTFGTLGNPNWTGEFLSAAALVSLGRLIDLRKSRSSNLSARASTCHWALVALILMVLALAATLARGAWLAFVIGAMAFLIVRRGPGKTKSRSKSAILPIVITGVAAVLLVGLLVFTNRDALNHLANLKSIRGRLWMSAVTWTMIRDAPLGGHGLGTFGMEFPRYQAQAFSRESAATFLGNASFTSYAHNDYLQLWAEVGIFGLLAFIALVGIVIKRGRHLIKDPVALGCWAATISLLVNAAVAFPLHLPATLMLFVVLVAVIEAAATKKTVNLFNRNDARVAVVLTLVVLCFSAYRLSYHRLRAESALWRAESALTAEDWTAADAAINTAMQHAPARWESHAMLGRLHFARGAYIQAVTAFERAQKLGYDAEIFDLKATALEASGETAAAITTLQEIVWLRPDLKWPRERLAALHQAANHPQEDRR